MYVYIDIFRYHVILLRRVQVTFALAHNILVTTYQSQKRNPFATIESKVISYLYLVSHSIAND